MCSKADLIAKVWTFLFGLQVFSWATTMMSAASTPDPSKSATVHMYWGQIKWLFFCHTKIPINM